MTTSPQPNKNNKKTQRPNPLSGALLAALLVIFLGAFGYAAYLFFQTTRMILANTPQLANQPFLDAGESLTADNSLGGAVPIQEPVHAQVDAAPAPVSSLLAPIWSEQEPINILLLGIDQRPGGKSLNTDTIILVNIDPATGNVGMMSIPRDLWVNIPGYTEQRINTAHAIGEAREHPGGGPTLTKETVASLLSQPVHYYVRINFEGFRTLLEEIGCLQIDVPRTIDDPEFPDDNFGFDPFYIEAGSHCMDADTVLKYARTRHTDSDFGRMQRQQQVLVAIKNRVLEPSLFPHLISRLPVLLNALSESLQTDMPTSEQITLVNLARQLNTDNIRQLVVDRSLTRSSIRPNGAYVLLPQMDAIQPAVQAFFNPEQAPPTPVVAPEIAELIQESAYVAILNGTANPDLAPVVAERLAEMGYNVFGYADADRTDYSQTQIIDYGGKPITLRRLVELLAVSDENIRPGASAESQIDIQIILGSDLQLPD